MKRFFSWLGGLFSKLPGIASHVAADLTAAAAAALPIVKLIADLTPTRADDEIVALFERFLVPGAAAYLALPEDQRGAALFKVATTVVQRQFPALPMEQIGAAVQLALVQVRAK